MADPSTRVASDANLPPPVYLVVLLIGAFMLGTCLGFHFAPRAVTVVIPSRCETDNSPFVDPSTWEVR